jgi:hypothetical protein
MAVRLSALLAVLSLLPRDIIFLLLVLIFLLGLSKSQGVVRLEGLS